MRGRPAGQRDGPQFAPLGGRAPGEGLGDVPTAASHGISLPEGLIQGTSKAHNTSMCCRTATIHLLDSCFGFFDNQLVYQMCNGLFQTETHHKGVLSAAWIGNQAA